MLTKEAMGRISRDIGDLLQASPIGFFARP